MSDSTDNSHSDHPIAWQYRGPGHRNNTLTLNKPTKDLGNWWPLYRGAKAIGVPEEEKCSVCGTPASQTAYGILTDVRVIVADGEEGFADIKQLLCDVHLELTIAAILGLGFKDHQHGGTDLLEDKACPGYDDMDACPTPTEYGAVVIQPPR